MSQPVLTRQSSKQKKIVNGDVKKMIIGLFHRPTVQNITSDRKLYDQIIEVSN